MAFDGLVTKSVVLELQSVLIGGKINKIYQPNRNEILLGIYSSGKNYALTICIDSNHCRIHLTTSTKPNPLSAPNFCMLLRKHLIGNRIQAIRTFGLERIIEIEMEGYNELKDKTQKKLMIELMGKHSNILLLNENDTIIDCLRHLDIASHSYRDLLPARKYVFPVSHKVDFTNLSSFTDFKDTLLQYMENQEVKDIPLDTLISNCFTGFSKSFIQYTCNQLAISLNNILDTDLKKLYDYLVLFMQELDNQNVCFTTYEQVRRQKIHQDYVLTIGTKEELLQLNWKLDDYYTQKEQNEAFLTYRNNMLRIILDSLKKYTNRLAHINQKLAECDKMDTYRIYGELLTSNLYRFQENVASVTLENYYENNKEITIPLDKRHSPSYNAKLFFKKYTKLKNALVIVGKQKEETKQELSYLESLVYELESAKTIADLDEIYNELEESTLFQDKFNFLKKKNNKKKSESKKKERILTPLTYHIDGYTILVGKNNKQNDYLTLKVARKQDLWFHTQKIHGSHVVLKIENRQEDIPESILLTCAKLAAYHSKGKNSTNVPVDYTFIQNVKKPSGSKPGMVVYVDYKTIFVTPEDFTKNMS